MTSPSQTSAFCVLTTAKFDVAEISPRLADIGDQAVWTVSSAKHGNGVLQLREDSAESYWQSDGNLPHTITLQFPGLTPVHSIALLLRYNKDESYTPSKITVRVGTHERDIAECAVVELNKPNGWVMLCLHDGPKEGSAPIPEVSKPAFDLATVYCCTLTVSVVENHQNGRDTHVRSMKVLSLRPSSVDVNEHPAHAIALR